MEKKLLISLNVLFFLTLIGLIIAVFGSSTPVRAQANPTATPTPNPTIEALEDKLAKQQDEINAIKDQLTDEERDRKYYDRDLQWKWGISGAIATAVIGFLTWAGIKQFKDLQENWVRSSQKILDKAIYKLDLSKIPVYLPAGEKLEHIHRLLQMRKFEKVGFYNNFDEFSEGVLVVSLAGKEEAERSKILDEFKKFIKNTRPSIAKSGFIIFAPGGIRVPDEVTNCHDNLVTANYPATVVSMMFVVGRGMDITPPESD